MRTAIGLNGHYQMIEPLRQGCDPRAYPRPDGGRAWWLAGRSSRRSTFALRASADSLHGYGSEGWAHCEFTRINIGPTILHKKIEDLREARRCC